MGKLAFTQRLGIAGLLICILGIAGCTSLPDPETSQDFTSNIVATISPGHSVGQTLTSRRPRLDGLTFWLEPSDPDSLLILAVYPSPSHTHPIFTTTVKIGSGPTRVEIPPLPDPPDQEYYIQLKTTQGEIQVFGRDEDIYPQGSAFRDDRPIVADLAFRVTYDYDWRAVVVDLGDLLRIWWVAIPLIINLWLPGWLLLDLSRQRQKFDPGEQAAISIGLSIATIPLLILWTSTVGIHWGRLFSWIFSGGLLIIFAWRILKNPRIRDLRENSRTIFPILAAIFVLALFARFAMVRDLAAPAWVDSVHHSLITNRILKSGGFPNDYLPHIPLEANQYHPGYHSILAVLIWLTGLGTPEAMLILGQVLNALMVFSVYLLTTNLVEDPLAGLVAALITGTLSLMPAYYTSWGRYTQLTGLLILPVGLCWIRWRTSTKPLFSTIFLGGIIIAGLFLVHYRVLIFLGVLVTADWISQLYRFQKNRWAFLGASIKRTAVMALISLLLSFPWLVPTINRFVIPIASQWRGNSTVIPEVHWYFLTGVFGIPVMVLAGFGLLWGIFKRRRFTITLLLWVLVLLILANPGYFHIPFPGGFINQTSVEILLFMPLSVLAGYAASQLMTTIRQRIPLQYRWLWQSAVLSLGAVIAILGLQRMVACLNPNTFLMREADLAAMVWIDLNILADEALVINPTGWGYGLYMGNDGGYWISPLTGRQTVPPNALYGMDGTNRATINQFIEEILPAGEDSEKIWEILRTYGYRYIYIGERGGVISPQSLKESPLFETRYSNHGTWVFETRQVP